jgi:protein ImuA
MGTVPSAIASAVGVAAALPHVWRASEMASFRTSTVPSGHVGLDRELPDGGWPTGTLIELLVQQPGIGEMRLLQTALCHCAKRAIGLIQPPHSPNAPALAVQGFPIESMVWVKTTRSADALWAAEQILRSGTFGGLLLWQAQVRNESLRRLHLAAQSSDTVFWLLRPLAAAHDPSPAPLRLALRPAAGGISIEIVKRRGPHRDQLLLVPLRQYSSIHPTEPNLSEPHDAIVDQRLPAVTAAGNLPSTLV